MRIFFNDQLLQIWKELDNLLHIHFTTLDVQELDRARGMTRAHKLDPEDARKDQVSAFRDFGAAAWKRQVRHV